MTKAASWRERGLLSAALAAALVLPARSALAGVTDPDLYWHLATARWIFEHGRFPRFDPFTGDGNSTPVVVYYWLFEWVVYGLRRAFGAAGPPWYSLAMVVTFGGAVYAASRAAADRVRPVTAILIVAWMGLACLPMVAPRPWMISMTLLAAELAILIRVRSRGETRLLWGLPPLFLLWANCHVQFVHGLFVLGLFAIEPRLERWIAGKPLPRSGRTTWAVLLACCVCCLIHPYGIGTYQTVLLYVGQGELRSQIGEFLPPVARGVDGWAAHGLALAGAFCLGRRPILRPFEVMLFGVGVVLYFTSQRDVWLLALATLPLLGSRGGLGPAPAVPEATPNLLGTVILLGVLLAISRSFDPLRPEAIAAAEAKAQPVAAIAWLRAQGEMELPIYSTFEWGGYLLWEVPGLRVPIDGRTNVHGVAGTIRALDTARGRAGWEADPALMAARTILIGAGSGLDRRLSGEAGFVAVYRDEWAVIFRRDPRRDRRADWPDEEN